MQLEICEADASGRVADSGLYPAATIVADNNETQWIELYPKEGAVRIRLSEFLKAIELAKDGVHGEASFDHSDNAES